jgi:predicted GNAT family acetyltransferase
VPTTEWERIRAYATERGDNLDSGVLVCAPLDLLPAESAQEWTATAVDAGSPIALLRENLDVNERGFDPAAPPVTDAQAEQFRPQLVDGRAVTVAVAGQAVAAGMGLPVRAGVAEVVGIATLQPFRHRGLGAVVTAELTRAAFARGADLVFLVPGAGGADRVYRRVGFRAPVAG